MTCRTWSHSYTGSLPLVERGRITSKLSPSGSQYVDDDEDAQKSTEVAKKVLKEYLKTKMVESFSKE